MWWFRAKEIKGGVFIFAIHKSLRDLKALFLRASPSEVDSSFLINTRVLNYKENVSELVTHKKKRMTAAVIFLINSSQT